MIVARDTVAEHVCASHLVAALQQVADSLSATPPAWHRRNPLET
jgi:hypothetical protein